ncbi:restriction endonuclease subunit S [Rhizobium leguminosarum]|uniref:restriction endonuclease subunit S n=1 Tax=Rhizobium leguminosarum TaxID=384 RepID=UPI0013B88BB5|nr:restriction endonuclease subunit S [Rhizobium leguminosarum]NEI61260.1 restriction endonuclease subunit S [Rhizobium leguminosarum]
MSNKDMGHAIFPPSLRFPEFALENEWATEKLGEIAELVTEKTGDKKIALMSITSGIGLVSQMEKFGREIAGSSYKNYVVIRKNDYAYNKSATKEYPEGFIAMFDGDSLGAVPNSIFTCFRIKDERIHKIYLNYLFSSNLHGKWLRRFLTVGARAHGSLNINNDDLFALPIPMPMGTRSFSEQQKIVDCLSALDELIKAQSGKIEALKRYKKGLAQELFPSEGESVPKRRFPEFEDAPGWRVSNLGDVASVSSGGTPSRTKHEYWNGNVPWITTTLIDFNRITSANEFITDVGLRNSSAKKFPQGTILMAMYGQGKTRGKVAILGINAAINQACAAITLHKGMNEEFVYQLLASRYENIRKVSNSGGQENLSGELVKKIPLSYPDIESGEQERIANCLSSVDENITAQSQKLDALRAHKKALIQGLLPPSGEVEHG